MKEKRIVILGAGESGIGAAVLAVKKGFDVFVSDFGTIKDNYKEILIKYKIAFEEGKHTPESILNVDEIIKSPGIPDNVEIISWVDHEKLINRSLGREVSIHHYNFIISPISFF